MSTLIAVVHKLYYSVYGKVLIFVPAFRMFKVQMCIFEINISIKMVIKLSAIKSSTLLDVRRKNLKYQSFLM